MANPRVAINGLGRIGRAVARLAAADPHRRFDVVAANDLAPAQQLAYLLRYDSVHRHTRMPVELTEQRVMLGDMAIQLLSEPDPLRLPWSELGVDVVVECTGRFRTRSAAAQHLTAGAQKTIISAPGDDKDPPDATVVFGVNDESIGPDARVISAASCTTTCLAPLAKTIHSAFGIAHGTMTTVHAYTADQSLVDLAHRKDARRGRAAAENIVPTSTGAATAIGLVVPELAGRLHGIALRVPVPDVSLVDLVVQTIKPVTAQAANDALAAAALRMRPGTLRMESDPVVSSDLVGETCGSVVDTALTATVGDHLLKIVSWYDNEWSYAARLYALIGHLANGGTP